MITVSGGRNFSSPVAFYSSEMKMRQTFLTGIVILSLVAGVSGREKIFSGSAFAEGSQKSETKSLSKAIGLSLLLPGMGERYLGMPSSGKYLTIGDGIIIGSAVSFAIVGAWKEQEYKTFAQKYAGVDPSGKDEEFFRIIGLYPDRDTYNYSQELYYRDDADLYPQTPEWNWVWRSEQDQLRYYDMRASAERMWRNFRIALGVAGINRLISTINVIRLYRGGAPLGLSAEINGVHNSDYGFKLIYSFEF